MSRRRATDGTSRCRHAPSWTGTGGTVTDRRPRDARHRTLVSVAVAAGVLVLVLAGLGIYELAFRPSSGLAIGTKLGTYRSASGAVSVKVLTCPNEHVREVELIRSNRNFADMVKTLWKITSSGASTESSFTAGKTPPGFQQDVSLAPTAIAASPNLIFLVRTDGPNGTFTNDFSLRDLTPGKLYIRGPSLLGTKTAVTPARFLSARHKVCSQQSQDIGG